MSATTIHFVRHGKVYNPDHLLYERLPDFHLSDLGRRMAQATAAYLPIALRPIRFPRCIRLPWTARARPPTRFLTR